MRGVWQIRLRKHYNEQELEWNSDQRVADRLGIHVQSLHDLSNLILSDLDESTFGVRWWSDLPIQSRVLIGDYLFQAIEAVQKNLIEAKVHLLEAESALDDEDRRLQRVRFDPPAEGFFPAPKSPQDELAGYWADLHIAGFVRASASALDCIAAAVIGILGLPVNLVKGDWSAVVRRLEETAESETPSVANFSKDLQAIIKAAGPEGWLHWLLQMRNTYVHRSRQTNIRVMDGAETPVYLPGGRLYLPFRLATLLPKYPGKTDVEIWCLTPEIQKAYLFEDGEQLLHKVFGSVVKLVETTASVLAEVWTARRSKPTLIAQPHLKQWPIGPESGGFVGYDDGSLKPRMDVIAVHPTLGHRMKAAAVLDPDKGSVWSPSNLDNPPTSC